MPNSRTTNQKHTYIAIDLKSFYASVECIERGLNPLTTNLVVADPARTEKTICLAVSPSLKVYGNESIDKVKENPFRLADDIWGIGFKTADSIAEKLGYGKETYVRLRSGIMYTLSSLADDGHVLLLGNSWLLRQQNS